jgi:pyridinium-3,5-bisthiocarboxylic acid mononucleotide nickel chelatase
MKILYIDPILGISGDMMISALIDAGLHFEKIEAVLKSLPLTLPRITPMRGQLGTVEGIHLQIDDSDLHYSPSEMSRMIGGLSIEPKIKDDAQAMLDIIVEAESKVHGVSKDSVHLHELSSIDTLIDILSVAAGINFLRIDKVYSGPVPCGRGTVKTAHGIMPNPPPATVEILKGFKTVFLDIPLELTTPTGATIVRHFVKDQGAPPPMRIEMVGYGLGLYEKTEKPDALRLFIGQRAEPSSDEEVRVIEADLDDMQMEYIGACTDRIREAGALDVLYFPIHMKKGRIGIRLSVTVAAADLDRITGLVFRETTTFGMRVRREERRVLRREVKVMQTGHGPIRVKYGYGPEGNVIKKHVEFEDVKKIADEKDLPYTDLLDTIKKEL